MTFASLLPVIATMAVSSHMHDGHKCDAQIASATVVATVCTHVAGEHQMLDLLILWRGDPGWFQRSENGRPVKEMVRDFPRGERGRVAQFRTYADVTVGFDADFDAGSVTIDSAVISLNSRNTILVDNVDVPHLRRITKTFRVDGTSPERGNTVVSLARRSANLREIFQCDVGTAPATHGVRAPPLRQSRPATVCELLGR